MVCVIIFYRSVVIAHRDMIRTFVHILFEFLINIHFIKFFSIAASRERNLLASCGEDGLVNIWDLSSEDTTPMKILKPFENVDCARKDKFLSALSFKGDWLVTGGGPNTSLWHIGAQEPAQM